MMIIFASVFVSASIFGAGWMVASAGEKIARAFAPADDAAFVPLDELLKEQYPEQFTSGPADFILEDDFSLLD